MIRYISRRLLNLIPTFFLATLLAWVVIDIAPGDFATKFALNQRDPNQQARVRESLGLNEPMLVRYAFWLRNVVTNFDFGISLTSRSEVTDVIVPRMVNSLRLLLPATIISYLIAIPIGIYSALHKYSLGDRILTVFTLVGVAVPAFFLALLVVAFAVGWFQSNGWFLIPVGGMTSQNYAQLGPWARFADLLWHLAAPTVVVTIANLAFISRFMRGEMLEVLGQDYIRTAKAKGLPQRSVVYKHAFKNAVLVIVATIGGLLPALIGGAGTVEFVMRWPGITPLFLSSIFAQDVYVIMALTTILVLLLMIGNLISDLALALIDPRIRY